MNKNMILLIGIIAIFLLIIRPVNHTDNKKESSTDYEEDLEVKTAKNNRYVEQSKTNNENTVKEEKKQYTK